MPTTRSAAAAMARDAVDAADALVSLSLTSPAPETAVRRRNGPK